jgi:hypothetical protein
MEIYGNVVLTVRALLVQPITIKINTVKLLSILSILSNSETKVSSMDNTIEEFFGKYNINLSTYSGQNYTLPALRLIKLVQFGHLFRFWRLYGVH